MQTSVFDPQIVRAPKAYDGGRKKFQHWSVNFKGYIMSMAPELKNMMDTATRLGEPSDVDDDLTTDDQKKPNNQLYDHPHEGVGERGHGQPACMP